MGTTMLRGLAWMALLGVIFLTSCQAMVAGGVWPWLPSAEVEAGR